jgi:hypothetical protein
MNNKFDPLDGDKNTKSGLKLKLLRWEVGGLKILSITAVCKIVST